MRKKTMTKKDTDTKPTYVKKKFNNNKSRFNTYNKPYNKKQNRYENNNIHVMNTNNDYSSDSNTTKIEADSNHPSHHDSDNNSVNNNTMKNEGTWAVDTTAVPIIIIYKYQNQKHPLW